MKSIESQAQFTEATKGPGLSCFLFTAGWCPDCVFIKPFLPAIEAEHPGITFYSVDRDRFPDLCRELGILGIPSFVCFKDGREVSRFVSKLRKTKAEIDAFLNESEMEGARNGD